LTEFPPDIQFKYTWRKYQQRVLDDLQEHLTDKHLHVIAPPGSGKTILGLEVALRLNQPTLVLAPTIAIRNQWIQRFCELFLQVAHVPDWISQDIRNPGFLTIVTYQGLHAACNGLSPEEKEAGTEDEEENQRIVQSNKSSNKNVDEIASKLITQSVKTIVVDEAHHLKNEWWQTLTVIKEKIDPVIVGLTATPPYDVPPNEWQRYTALNGPVDSEISVPELVIEGDLCPHQDYIYFNFPTADENNHLTNFRENSEQMFREIKNDTILLNAIENHPIWVNPMEKLDWIYTNLSCYSACLIFLYSNGREIPETHLNVIGDKKINIPKLDYNWIAVLLDFYLYKDPEYFVSFKEHQKTLENKLRRHGLIEKRQINFSNNKRVSDFLISSIGKLNGIKEIVDLEYNVLKKDLRMVILTDFIRKEFLVSSTENDLELNKIGVIPIFEKLRRTNTDNKKIGILSGSVVIIPTSALPALESEAAKFGISTIQVSPLPFDNNYLQINQTEQLKNDVIHLVTHVFQSGEIEILIGTKSLLGEGWDAPAVNTLVLASFVGSFVLSNQMRGRAIRTQRGNPGKTGNIWHLVTIDPTSDSGGNDLDLLKRRFKSFVGISLNENPNIENGIGRLSLPDKIHSSETIVQINAIMAGYSSDRERLKHLWKKAIESGKTLIEEIKIPFSEEKTFKSIKSIYLNKTIASLLITLGSGVGIYLLEALSVLGKSARRMKTSHDLYLFLMITGIIGVIFFGGMTVKTLRLYLKYRDISKDIQQIGNTLLQSLVHAGIIRQNAVNKVVSSSDKLGAVCCHLEGGSTYERSIFIRSLQEIVEPIDNPRYMIVRKHFFMRLFQQKDFHAVPEIIGRNKKLSEHFENQWRANVGSCELIFTRNPEGRAQLLKYRIKSLSAQFDKQITHVNKWK
jgi:superfamily II DNA or RNA helicase